MTYFLRSLFQEARQAVVADVAAVAVLGESSALLLKAEQSAEPLRIPAAL
jgi:hypothetical protein